MSPTPIRVLVVDDSATARAALRLALGDDPGLVVVGEAADGPTATRLVRELGPDIVTMDVFLRAESGIDVAAAIMSTKATPIVIVTASDPRDPSLVFRAMQAGVLELSAKLPSPTHPDYDTRKARLVRTLKTLASVPVIHRFTDSVGRSAPPSSTMPVVAPRPPSSPVGPLSVPAGNVPPSSSVVPPPTTDAPVLLIGASTGGPPVLSTLLRALPRRFAMPIVVVQHMTPGFMRGFGNWLASDTGHPVELVDSARSLVAGTLYVPADEHHLVLEAGRRVAPSSAPPRGFHRPSIDLLFESAATPTQGPLTIAVLLTGMGSDGAHGLLSLRRAGAWTIAQEPTTCAVRSMPEQAIALGAAEAVLPPAAVANALVARAAAFSRTRG